MDGSRFDELTMTLARRLTRRSLGRRVGLTATAMLAAGTGLVGRQTAAAQDRPSPRLPNSAKCKVDGDCLSDFCERDARGRSLCTACVAPTIAFAPNVTNGEVNGVGWTIPAGLSQSCIASPDDVPESEACPIIRYCGWTWWIYSYIDNRSSFGLVAYDRETGMIVDQVEAPGARYVWAADIDSASKVVVISGQANEQAIVSWTDLAPS